jgi:pantoate--beta-alanine ligase
VKLVHTREDLAKELASRSDQVGLVMTMGALHSGHATLLRQARLRAATVVATVFVNPLQFGVGEDFDRYPRTLDADAEICAAEQVDVVFAPPVEEVFPARPLVTVQAGPLGEILEGASRPGHFDGMLTVVNRMFHLVDNVEAAFFGEKDYQQLALIRQMVTDFALRPDVVGVPTVREADGLALSSRNRYLSAQERQAAVALSRALRAGAEAADPVAVARQVLDAEPGIDLDYLALTGPDLGPAPATGEARLLVAARLGTTRLIDNLAVHLAEGH